MKTTLLICLGLLLAVRPSAQVSGPNSAASFVNSSLGGSSASWTDPEFAGASDNKYAVFGNIPGFAGNYTDYLLISDFGFTLPADAVVYGIIVDIERSDPNLLTADYSIRILKAGLLGSSEKSTGQAYPATDATQSYGSSSDLWGESWSYKDIDNANFGVAIAAQRASNGGITAGGIDNVQITVFYGFKTLPVTLVAFAAVKQNKTVLVNWKTASENSMDHYSVERSADGKNFFDLGSVTSRNEDNASYALRDDSPLAGTSYYRLRMQELSGRNAYSSIVPVHFDKLSLATLSPSPWQKGSALYVYNPIKESLTIRFYNNGGQLVGTAVTRGRTIDVPAGKEMRGLVYYNISDRYNQLKGIGTLVIE